MRLLNDILNELLEAGVITAAAAGDGKDLAYHPGSDINKITVRYVCEKIAKRGDDNIPVAQDNELAKLKDSLRSFNDLVKGSSANLLLKDI